MGGEEKHGWKISFLLGLPTPTGRGIRAVPPSTRWGGGRLAPYLFQPRHRPGQSGVSSVGWREQGA